MQYEELIRVSRKAEKSEKKFQSNSAMNPFRHTTKFSKLPVAFAALKLDLIGTGIVERCITTDEVGKFLSVKHKASNQAFEVNSFQNIGINTLLDWTVREASRIYHAVEASKFRGIDRFQKIVHATKNGNAEWLTGRIDESSMMADANR